MSIDHDRSATPRDLMHQDEIRDVVRTAYGSIPTGAGTAMAEQLYRPDELESVPETAIVWALGVGNPVRHASLAAGEVVLDLGSGGGIDAVLAAHRVGPTGRVIGLDLLPEMSARAREAARQAGVGDRCEFVDGQMEDIPLPDETVDVVISNGVINLSPRKSRTLAEIARVLRPGGRLCVADLVVEEDLPPEILASGALWAGCVAGAVSERVLVKKLRRAGMADVEVGHRRPFGIEDAAAYPLFTPEVLDLMRRLLPRPAQERVAVSVVVRARRTADPDAASAPPVAEPTRVRLVDEIPPDHVEAPGVTVRHLKSVEDVHLKTLDVEPGGSTPFHTHPHAHEGVVVDGVGALRLQDRAVPLRAGHAFFVRPRERHAIECHGDVPLRFVCMDCFV